MDEKTRYRIYGCITEMQTRRQYKYMMVPKESYMIVKD